MGDDTGLADFVRRLHCVVCAWTWWGPMLASWATHYLAGETWPAAWQPQHVAHLVKRGAGHGVVTDHVTKDLRPAGTPCVVPLCPPHHTDQEEDTQLFCEQYNVDLWVVAKLIAEAFEVKCGQ